MTSVSPAKNLPAEPARPRRLASLDALRGFDMFWIIGGAEFVLAVAKRFGRPGLVETLKTHSEHVGWDGFVAIDFVFPLFVFIMGAAMPFSLSARLEAGESRWRLYGRVLRRVVLLVVLGLLGGLLSLDLANIRPLSVLGLIGMAYLIAAMVVLHRGVRGQAVWAVGILAGSWAALCFIPVPGFGPGVITPGGNLAGYIDRNLLPGKLYQGVFDPEGILTWPPAAAMALLGALAGRLLRDGSERPYRNVLVLAGAGVVLGVLGLAWGQWIAAIRFPIVKALWTSSYVLLAGGISLLLLALFYLVVDVWRGRWLVFPFIPIGMNAITIYVGGSFIDFSYTAKALFGGAARVAGEDLAAVILTGGVLVVEWAMLYFLYRKRIFLRV